VTPTSCDPPAERADVEVCSRRTVEWSAGAPDGQALADLDTRISEAMAPLAAARSLLMSIPGVSRIIAQVLLAETGADMSVFPTAAHLASWAGTAPGCNESAGTVKSTKTRRGNPSPRSSLAPSPRSKRQSSSPLPPAVNGVDGQDGTRTGLRLRTREPAWGYRPVRSADRRGEADQASLADNPGRSGAVDSKNRSPKMGKNQNGRVRRGDTITLAARLPLQRVPPWREQDGTNRCRSR
jgi:hypothetical protein